MLNRVWAGMILLAFAAGVWQVVVQADLAILAAMGNSVLLSAKAAVDTCLGLVAALVVWLGLYEIAQASGMVAALARFTYPLVTALLPDIPRDHPVFGSISANLAMSMLGMDDAALPSGLQTMQSLEALKPEHMRNDGVASRSQQMFMVYMTASVTLMPVAIIGFRLHAGAAHPADVLLPVWVAGYCGLLAGLMYVMILQGIRLPLAIFMKLLLVCSLAAAATYGVQQAGWMAHIAGIGNGVLLSGVAMIVAIGVARGVPVYDCFVHGAGKGFAMAVGLIPYVAGMLLAIGLLRASGLLALLYHASYWVSYHAGWQAAWMEALPQGVLKMFSASASRAVMLDILAHQGPDSMAGHIASVVQGASDTTFYVLATCSGAARLRQLGHASFGALVVAASAFVVAVSVCQWWYS